MSRTDILKAIKAFALAMLKRSIVKTVRMFWRGNL